MAKRDREMMNKHERVLQWVVNSLTIMAFSMLLFSWAYDETLHIYFRFAFLVFSIFYLILIVFFGWTYINFYRELYNKKRYIIRR